MSARWVIINISDLEESRAHRDCYFIRDDRRPTLLHEDRESAEKELVRLARNYPTQEFWLFEAVAVGTPIQTCAGGPMS